MNRATKTAVVLAAMIAALVTVRTAAAPAADDQAIVHVLNRIGFGPRPGDIQKVRQMGLSRFIDQQLHPERVPDAALPPRLDGFTTLTLTSRQIAERYEQPALKARRDRKRAAANDPNPDAAPQKRAPMDPQLQQANLPMAELTQQKILRAVYSERQLQEVLTDFWFNHFNVDARKGPVRYMLTEYERDAIRPHVLSRFRDLLEATAKSPAMLFYLDNWQSASPVPVQDQQIQPRRVQPRGIQPRRVQPRRLP